MTSGKQLAPSAAHATDAALAEYRRLRLNLRAAERRASSLHAASDTAARASSEAWAEVDKIRGTLAPYRDLVLKRFAEER